MAGTVSAFFDRFADASDRLDLEVLGECFADPFLFADPSGTRAVPRPAFLAALPQRAAQFAAAGIGSARLTGVDPARLDSRYLLVRTVWEAPRSAGGDPIVLESSFLLFGDDDGRLRIVLYLNHRGL